MFRRHSLVLAFSAVFFTTSASYSQSQTQPPSSDQTLIQAVDQWWPWPSNSTKDKPKAAAPQKMPALHLDSQSITVSGISAGAYMATQLQMAYSATFTGVGSVAGGPWNCADGTVWQAQTNCMNTTSNINVQDLVSDLRAAERAKDVDTLDNLKRIRVYLYNSDTDGVVRPPIRKKNIEFFEHFVPKANIKVEQDLRSAHGFPTVDYGVECGLAQSPYLMKCNYDTAGEILKQMYPGTTLKKTKMAADSLYVVDQSEFSDDGALLGANAYLYVPKACAQGRSNCRLHVALHGCLQADETLNDVFAVHAGYNEWAEGSDIVVLYPQARKSMMNPNGCFDWFGYAGADYAVKSGRQMRAIKGMIDRLVSP